VVSSQPAGAYSGGEPDCPADQLAAIRRAMEGVAGSIHLELSIFAGPVSDGSAAEALAMMSDVKAATFRAEIAVGPPHCRAVGVVLPRTARFVSSRYEAADQEAAGSCQPGADCDIGRARWLGRPEIVRGSSSTVVYGIFQNLAEDRERRARLSVVFRPPSANWRPESR
jgi:hypothetical protein